MHSWGQMQKLVHVQYFKCVYKDTANTTFSQDTSEQDCDYSRAGASSTQQGPGRSPAGAETIEKHQWVVTVKRNVDILLDGFSGLPLV